MPRLPPALRRALRAAVTVGIAAYIVAHVDMRDLGHALRGVRPGLFAAAFALYVAGQALSAWKWALLGHAVGLARPVRDYVRFYFVGMFFNLVGPSTVGGDVARGLYLGAGRRTAVALNSVVFDRVTGLAFLMALGAAALLFGPGYDLPRPLVAAVVGGGAGLVLGWWLCPRLGRLLPAGNRLRRLVEVDLAPFWHARGLARVAALSLVFHLSQVGVQWILARAAGATIPFAYCLVYHPVISVMAALPVSIAGLGVREGGYLYFLTRAGWDESVAVTIGLLWFTMTVLANLLGGVVFLASGATPPPLASREPTADAMAEAARR
jgi:glycosyltransferase 2 family protein